MISRTESLLRTEARRLLKIDRVINNVFIKLPIGLLLVVNVTLVVLQVTLIFILRHYSKSPANNINSLSAPISRVISTLLMEAEIANGHRTPTCLLYTSDAADE